jgi:hypothetical protein
MKKDELNQNIIFVVGEIVRIIPFEKWQSRQKVLHDYTKMNVF